MANKRPRLKFILLLLVFIMLPGSSGAEEAIGDAVDCTDVRIDYVDDPNLTREENLVRMDEALVESLNRFERCQKARALAGQAAGAGENGPQESDGTAGLNGSRESESGAGDAGGRADEKGSPPEDEVKSIASSSMSGMDPDPSEFESQPEKTDPPDAGYGKIQAEPEKNTQSKGRTNTDSGGETTSRMDNGKTPEDIPPAENDDALAAQIRYAAENETDPQKKAQLWNEYRKYKGIAQK